jgi:gluconate 5-dehydrogenase
MMSELGRDTVSAYAAAKGGLKMLTKNMATEWGATTTMSTRSFFMGAA